MKVSQKHFDMMRDMTAEFLSGRAYGHNDVLTGADAWTILHRSGAYRAIGEDFTGGYPDYDDSHLKTAMKRIFPLAIFKN